MARMSNESEFRDYLTAHVRPALHEALLTCYLTKPMNPVQWLGEHLLRGVVRWERLSKRGWP